MWFVMWFAISSVVSFAICDIICSCMLVSALTNTQGVTSYLEELGPIAAELSEVQILEQVYSG